MGFVGLFDRSNKNKLITIKMFNYLIFICIFNYNIKLIKNKFLLEK